MFNRNAFKYIRSIVPEAVVSTDSTSYNATKLHTTSLCSAAGYTTRPFGQNFSVTIEATTGAIYILPDQLVEPTSANAFKIPEGGIVDLKVRNYLSVKGDSTTAKYQAIIWGDV